MCAYISFQLLATSTTTIWISFDQHYIAYNRFVAIFSVIFIFFVFEQTTMKANEKKKRFDDHYG